MNDPAAFRSALDSALARRASILGSGVSDAVRLIAGDADGLDGVYLDRYGPGAVLALYQGRAVPEDVAAASEVGTQMARVALATLGKIGLRAVYLKPFARDRSHLGGIHPDLLSSPQPAAGEPLPESFLITEHGTSLEVRLYDGFSTGLFLDQRENRRHLARLASSHPGLRVLNTFSYTCAFSVACAREGAVTTSVDVSARYLEWGKRNFHHNHVDPDSHRFAKMDTFEFLEYARRKSLQYDLIILDPPSYASGNKRRGIPTWSAVDDYKRLVAAAAERLSGGGLIFASTNTGELCRPRRLEREITAGLGRNPEWLKLPEPPADFAAERDRFAARLFSP